MIAAAPTMDEGTAAQFRFLRIGNHAGRWHPAATDQDMTGCVATMALSGTDRGVWHFRLDQPPTALRPLPAIDKAALLAGVRHVADGASCPIHDPAMLWDLLVYLAEHRWEPEYPKGMWLTAIVTIPAWPVPTPPAGSQFSITLTKQRRQAIEIAFSIDGLAMGTALFTIILAAETAA